MEFSDKYNLKIGVEESPDKLEISDNLLSLNSNSFSAVRREKEFLSGKVLILFVYNKMTSMLVGSNEKFERSVI